MHVAKLLWSVNIEKLILFSPSDLISSALSNLAFSLIEEEQEKSDAKEQKNRAPELLAVKDAVALLNPGDVSDFVPSGTDGFIAILEKRESLADANAGEKKAAFEKRILENKERIVLVEWLRDRQQAAGLEFKKG